MRPEAGFAGRKANGAVLGRARKEGLVGEPWVPPRWNAALLGRKTGQGFSTYD